MEKEKELEYGKHFLTIITVLIVVAHLFIRLPGERLLLILFRFLFTPFVLYKLWAGAKWAKTTVIVLGGLTGAYLLMIQAYVGQFSIAFSLPALIFIVSAILLIKEPNINMFLENRKSK